MIAAQINSTGLVTNTIIVDSLNVIPGLIDGTGAAIGDTWDGSAFIHPTPPTIPLATRQAAAWERIKTERVRRKVLGVKVGAHWFHSDADSRIQQLGLVIMGTSVPAVQWKTLTPNGSSVFVTMTQAIAAGIFQNTAASDTAIFEAAETHRLAMEASSTPESYEFTSGWPISIEDQAD
jgi:hypothetical protein